MSFWQNALTWMGWPTGAQDGDNVRTGHVTTTEQYTDGNGASSGTALGLSATWACVNFWAGNIAGLPLTIYRKGPSGIPVEAPDHPLFWLLHTSPNYDQSAFDFWEFMVASIELYGNAYAVIEKRDSGFIVSLTPVMPNQMSVTRTRNGELQYKWTDGSERTLPQEQVLHIRGFGGGPLGGLSPLQVCRRSFNTAVATDKAASATFANGVRPSGVLSMADKISPETRTALEEGISRNLLGAMNAGRPMVLDRGMTWEQLSMNPDDAQMLESRQFSVEDICRIFEVDPHLVGHTSGNTNLGSSIADQTLSLLKFKMRKRLKRIEGALEKQLLTREDRAAGISIEFNVEGFLRADSLGRAQYYEIMKQFMTKNEVRALEGLPPVEGGDVLFAQMQDIPLAKAITGPKETVQ